ncbi:hypothetical protein D9758_016295 [Tetrapyrgos nigripes]|uniref:Uncharacterized protein n=1 Tax=Tetrapyrgos nigripes TaxID=182062 RepID=A0A8H5C9N0_9AGAR|nr:hypothetical protein D9758_016295 [Tetrapyrgos nigripes]
MGNWHSRPASSRLGNGKNGNGNDAGQDHDDPPPSSSSSPSPPQSDPPQNPPPEQTIASTSNTPEEISTTTASVPDPQTTPANADSRTATTTALETLITTFTTSVDGSISVLVSTITTNTPEAAITNSESQASGTRSPQVAEATSESQTSKSEDEDRPLASETAKAGERATVVSYISTTTTLSPNPVASTSPIHNTNGFLSNKPAAIATFVISSVLFLVLLGIITRLIFKCRRRRRRQQRQRRQEEDVFAFVTGDGTPGTLQSNRRGELVPPSYDHGYNRDSDGLNGHSQSRLIGGPGPGPSSLSMSEKYIPPPEYREEGYGFGSGSSGTNARINDEKPRDHGGSRDDGQENHDDAEAAPSHLHRRQSLDSFTTFQSSRTSLLSA